MAKEFEFKEIPTELVIYGKSYAFNVSSETPKICGEVLTEARRRLKIIRTGKKEKSVEESEICRFFKESIERLLGKGTVESIFESGQQKIDEVAEVLCLIAGEIRRVFLEYDRELSREEE